MAIIRRSNEKQFLDKVPVYIEDTSLNSDYFQVFELPEVFPAGKSAFKINGSNLLKKGSEVRVEITDADGEVIYSEYPKHLEGVSRFVSLYVYPDTLIGKATLTILGEAVDVPEEWKGFFNVRWQRDILINPFLQNTQQIRFYTKPTVTANEIIQPYLNRLLLSGSLLEYSTGSMVGLVGTDEYLLVLNPPGRYDSRMLGAQVNVPRPRYDYPAGCVSSSYSTTIQAILNTSTAIASTPYVANCNNSTPSDGTFESRELEYPPEDVFPFEESVYTMSFQEDAEFSASENYRSFAKVRIRNLDTFSGDVHSIKVYVRSVGSIGSYELIADDVIENREILVDESSPTLTRRIGQFTQQSIVDDYWTSGSNNFLLAGEKLRIFATSSQVLDAMFISGSPYGFGAEHRIRTTSSYEFFADSEYTFAAEMFARKKPLQVNKYDLNEIGNEAELIVYMSGSAFIPKTIADRKYGKEIARFSIDNNLPTQKFSADEGFVADNDGTGSLYFRVLSGDWMIGNISLKVSQETGFNPSTVTIIAPVPDWQRDDVLKFKTEFFDVNGRRAFTVVESDEVGFAGGNLFIGGTDNLLSGSIFIGNAIGSGIEIAGVNSAYIRSIGYLGYSSASQAGYGRGGFMLWSGSVLSNITSDYTSVQDVGFEFHGGSGSAPDGGTHAIRFRTSTGKLEVTGSIFATDGIFSGLLSAATGSIGGWLITSDRLTAASGSLTLFGEGIISSSNFYLGPDGNVTASNFLFQGGTIKEDVVIEASLSANSIAVPTTGGGQGPGGYKAFIGSDGFAYFETGSIAGWSITTGALTSGDILISGSGAISSSGFHLREDGTVTASKFLLEGGVITGDVVIEASLSVNEIVAPSSPPHKAEIRSSGFARFTSASIGGWDVDNDAIQSSGIIISSSGSIASSNFQSGLRGWKITSAGNGFAEFETVSVRGTLSTTVFEKETVNAVGGQLWVANSTVITGSAEIGPSETTWSVANSTGWAPGEVLIVKQVNSTGFTTEYVRVDSSSLDGNGETTFNGKLYVTRSYDSSTQWPDGFVKNVSGSLVGDSGSVAGPTYYPGQVLTSTGLSGSGYIRLNANPKDYRTPYIDIIERTGSGIFDVELRARIGDLSGLSPNLVFGSTSPGFGIFTQNGYFQGTVTATTGSFTGIVHVGDFKIGNNVTPEASSGIYLNDNNYWFDDGNWQIGSATEYIRFQNDAGSVVFGPNVTLSFGQVDGLTSYSASAASNLNTVSSSAATDIAQTKSDLTTTSASIATDVAQNTSDITSNSASFASDLTNISSSAAQDISASSANATTALGNIQDVVNGVSSLGGTFISQDFIFSPVIAGLNGYFSESFGVGDISNNRGIVLNGDSAGGPSIFIGAGEYKNANTPFFVSSGSTPLFSLGDKLSFANGNLVISGAIAASTGFIADWTITGSKLVNNLGLFALDGGATGSQLVLSSSTFQLNANGDFTASQVLFSGGKITSDVTIEGSVAANSIAVPVGGGGSGPGGYKAYIDEQGFAYFETASIAGWDVTTEAFSSNDTFISSSGIIQLGSNTIGLDEGTGTGIFLSGSGDFRVGNATQYLKFTTSTGTLTLGPNVSITFGNVTGLTEFSESNEQRITNFSQSNEQRISELSQSSETRITTNQSNVASNLSDIQAIVNGTYTGGTYIDGTTVFAPIIAGTTGYFSQSFGVGDIAGGRGIILDGTSSAIYIGDGNFNNSDTGFYVSSGSQGVRFSLGNELYYSGSVLNVEGTITANSIIVAGALPDFPPDSSMSLYLNFDSQSINQAYPDEGQAALSEPTNFYVTESVAGKAVELSGTTQYITANNQSFGASNGEFSVTFWVKPTSVGAGLFSILNAGTTNGFYARNNSGNITFSSVNYGGGSVTGNAGISLNVWNFIAIVFNFGGDSGKIYLNGEFVSEVFTGDLVLVNNPKKVNIGSDEDANITANGIYDEFRIYDGELTSTQIRALYVNPTGTGGTAFSGNQIVAGRMRSTNWDNSSVGSLFDLDLGTIHLGGSGSNAQMYFDGTDLFVSGTVSAQAGDIGGWNITSDKIGSPNRKLLSLNSDSSSLYVYPKLSNYNPVVSIGNIELSEVTGSPNVLTNPDFDSGLTNWTNPVIHNSESRATFEGGSSAWVADGINDENVVYFPSHSADVAYGMEVSSSIRNQISTGFDGRQVRATWKAAQAITIDTPLLPLDYYAEMRIVGVILPTEEVILASQSIQLNTIDYSEINPNKSPNLFAEYSIVTSESIDAGVYSIVRSYLFISSSFDREIGLSPGDKFRTVPRLVIEESTLAVEEPFVEISPKGVQIYRSPSDYIRSSPEEFVIKSSNVSFANLNSPRIATTQIIGNSVSFPGGILSNRFDTQLFDGFSTTGIHITGSNLYVFNNDTSTANPFQIYSSIDSQMFPDVQAPWYFESRFHGTDPGAGTSGMYISSDFTGLTGNPALSTGVLSIFLNNTGKTTAGSFRLYGINIELQAPNQTGARGLVSNGWVQIGHTASIQEIINHDIVRANPITVEEQVANTDVLISVTANEVDGTTSNLWASTGPRALFRVWVSTSSTFGAPAASSGVNLSVTNGTLIDPSSPSETAINHIVCDGGGSIEVNLTTSNTITPVNHYIYCEIQGKVYRSDAVSMNSATPA